MKDEFFRKRVLDLANQADRQSRFTFTDFLTEAEYAGYHAVRGELPRCGVTVWGGHENADRIMLRFGDAAQLGYEEPFPITVLCVEPLQEKFADALTHRDFLGALMNLGIERSLIGDILIDGKSAYILCESQIADYICRNIERIRHTSVKCAPVDAVPAELAAAHTENVTVQAASPRADAVICKLYHISRGDCITLFQSEKVALNGAVTTENSRLLKEGERVSVRGYGKFRYMGITGSTRKGNALILLERYV